MNVNNLSLHFFNYNKIVNKVVSRGGYYPLASDIFAVQIRYINHRLIRYSLLRKKRYIQNDVLNVILTADH